MEWINKYAPFIMLIIAALGWFAQILYGRWQIKDLIKWQDDVNKKLASIDSEINQIKISNARENIRTNLLTEDIGHIRRSLDDLREMFIMALSAGTLKIKRLDAGSGNDN